MLDTHDGENSTMHSDEQEYPCLLRATDGKKLQISTRVSHWNALYLL